MNRRPSKNPSCTRAIGRSRTGVTFAIVLFAGCDTGTNSPVAEQKAALVKTAEVTGVKLKLSADSDHVTTAEIITIQLEVEAEDGFTIAVESYENALRQSEDRFDFRLLRSTREESVPTPQGKLRWRYTYDLEFVLPESYELPPAVITYTDTRRSAATPVSDGDSHSLATEGLTIVARPLSDEQPNPDEMATVKTPPPVELPVDWAAWWWVIPVFIVAIVMLAFTLRRMRRDRTKVKYVTPAHEWAQRELSALASERLVDRGLVQQFHYRISDIVRGYVERRFDVAAPEMTTEEFLAKAAGDGRFGPDVTGELERFLEACDIVKYARVEPGPDSPSQLMHTAGDFVDRTKVRTTAGMTEVETHHVEDHTI